MGLTSLETRYRINGLIDTSKPVMQNLEGIANSCGCWVTYDILEGLWAVVINKPETSTHSFTDDNIIGSLNVSGTGLDNYYNAVEVQYPHLDLLNQSDFVRIDMPTEDRNPNEQDNTLKISYPLVDDPVQAELLGFIDLKQSRVNDIVSFKTDYSQINLEAGAVVDITNTIFDWDEKLFRIIKLTEIDDDTGINIQITALAYDANVYDPDDLYRYIRSNSDGIIQIGALGKPGTPQVTKFAVDARPGIVIESTIPDNLDPLNEAGLVEGLEFWLYFISPAEMPNWELVDDDARKYTLHQTLAPIGGATFEPGFDAVVDIDNISANNILVKTKAVNGSTSGPYSEHGGLVEYIPVQVTDAINADPGEFDFFNSISGLLAGIGITELLARVFSSGITDPTLNYLGVGGLLDQLGLAIDGSDITRDNGAALAVNVTSETGTVAAATAASLFNAFMGTPTLASGHNGGGTPDAVGVGYVTPFGASVLNITANSAIAQYDIQYYSPISNSEQTVTNVFAFLPCYVRLYRGGVLISTKTVDWQTSSTFFAIEDVAQGEVFDVRYEPLVTYDLNQDNPLGGPGGDIGVWPFNTTLTADLTVNFTSFQ